MTGKPLNRREIGAHSAAVRTEQLEYITAVTRLGSLRRATDELRLSQPALSETVRLQRRKADSVPQAARDLHEAFVRTAHGLTGRDLTGADLTGARPTDADPTDAHPTGADPTGGGLTGGQTPQP